MLCCRFFNKSSFRLLAPAKSPFRVPATHLLLFLSYIISSFCRLFQTSVTPSTFQQYHYTLGSEQRRRHDENVCFSHLLFTGVVSSFLYWFFFFFMWECKQKSSHRPRPSLNVTSPMTDEHHHSTSSSLRLPISLCFFQYYF